MLSCLLFGSCYDVEVQSSVSEKVVASNAVKEIANWIVLHDSTINLPMCVSDNVIVPSYLIFENAIRCDLIDTTGIVGKIYRGYDCEGQYVYNLQHSYKNPWDTGDGSHSYKIAGCYSKFDSKLYLSSYQNNHMYGLLVNTRDLINDDSYIVEYLYGIEFMLKIDTTGSVEWMEVMTVEDMTFTAQ